MDNRAKWKKAKDLNQIASSEKMLICRSENQDIFVGIAMNLDGKRYWVYGIGDLIEINDSDTYLMIFSEILLNTIVTDNMMNLVTCVDCHNYWPDCECV